MNTMWCKYCRQDVPAQTAPAKQRLCCPRCGGDIEGHHHRPEARSFAGDQGEVGVPWAAGPADAQPRYDGWEMDEQLRHIERMLRSAEGPRRERRIDFGHVGQPPWHASALRSSSVRRSPASRAHGLVLTICTWFFLALGTTCSLGGGTLLAWSVVDGRQQLWTVGLAATLLGQIILLVALTLQTGRLWRHSRRSAAKLDSVDEQLRELKTSATLPGAPEGPGSSAFYSHLAGGASPALLLADLKSQIDLVALKIARQNF
jgi:hypothetical protein